MKYNNELTIIRYYYDISTDYIHIVCDLAAFHHRQASDWSINVTLITLQIYNHTTE